MILKEILEEVRARYPSDFEEDDAIIFLNSALRQFGRYIGKCTVKKVIAEGVSEMDLPEEVKPECVKGVFLGERELMPKEFGRLSGGDYALEPGGKIVFSAKTEGEINIHHNSCSFALKRDDAEDFDGQEMGIDEEYTGAVIFAIIADFCEACEDINASNNYRAKSEEIIKRARQGRYQKRGKYPVTRDVLGK